MISKGRVIRIGVFFSIANFLITAILGVVLRYNTIFSINGFLDRYWIHAHSHTGFLGWVFVILAIFGFAFLLPKNAKINRRMYRLLIYFQIAVLGMLVTFPFMGYAAPSIIFSTLHMILSIFYVVVFFNNADSNDLAVKFMKAGLIFMLISSIGPLALGPIIVGGFRGTEWYDMAIYYYLHFQYNGWFTLAVFALLINFMIRSGIQIDERKGTILYRLLVLGTIMTLALSALGFDFSVFAQIVGMVGAVLQLWAGILLLKMLFVRADLNKIIINNWAKWFFGIALFSWLLKIVMQFFSSLPTIADFVYLSRDAIMTYLHLSFLGFTSCFVIGLLIANNYLKTGNLISRIGYMLFLFSVVSMELTIGLRSIPQYLSINLYKSINSILLVESFLLFVSIFIMLFYGFILSNRVVKQRNIS